MADTEKTLKTRILLSYDALEEWETVPAFKPARGEVIVVADATNAPEYFVIGNGETPLIPTDAEPLPKFYPMNPNNYATKKELSNYYTKSEVNTQISTAISNAITNVLKTPV